MQTSSASSDDSELELEDSSSGSSSSSNIFVGFEAFLGELLLEVFLGSVEGVKMGPEGIGDSSTLALIDPGT